MTKEKFNKVLILKQKGSSLTAAYLPHSQWFHMGGLGILEYCHSRPRHGYTEDRFAANKRDKAPLYIHCKCIRISKQ